MCGCEKESIALDYCRECKKQLNNYYALERREANNKKRHQTILQKEAMAQLRKIQRITNEEKRVYKSALVHKGKIGHIDTSNLIALTIDALKIQP
jgi:hypothetical protein